MIRWLLFPGLFLFFGGCPFPLDSPPQRMLEAGVGSSLSFGLVSAADAIPFPYGVASGDPLEDAVILWTMLDTLAARQDSTVRWEISQDPTFGSLAGSGEVMTSWANHYRVKIDATELAAGATYFYRFRHRKEWSEVGRTRTALAQDAVGVVRLAVVSCNALEWGYMNAFDRIAALDDLSAVVHLGDYIYEYGSGVYGDTTLGRFHEPRHELVTAQDYHQRYAQYRRDPQLRAAHRVHPFICVWDDHEVANNSHLTGAENHDGTTQGDYLTRMTAAKQIYYDWMPIREQANGAIYRRFDFGQLVTLHMLDERLAGRDAPAESFDPAEVGDTARHMLGEAQLEWLCEGLGSSQAAWQLIGNQVLFANLDLSKILPEYALNLDAWDGYAYERQRLLDSIARYNNPNTIFLTGDTHCSWYLDVNDGDGKRLAHELGTPSVSSANYDELIGGWDTLAVASYRLYRDNEHLRYTNIQDHGYLLLQLEADRAQAEFHFSSSIRQVTAREKASKIFTLPYDHRTAR